MNIFGHPIDVWLIVIVAAVVKLLTKTTMGIVGAISTAVVGIGAGIALYQPVAHLMGFAPESHVIIACSITLIFENLARNLVLRTEDPKALDAAVAAVWNRIVGRGNG